MNEVTRPPIVSGTIDLPEISGAVVLDDRLLVVADDVEDEADATKRFNMVALVSGARLRLKSGRVSIRPDEQAYRAILAAMGSEYAGRSSFVTDLEDVAVAPDGTVYAVTSHSLSKAGKSPDKRRRLLRLSIDPASGVIRRAQVAVSDLVARLPEGLRESAKRRPGDTDPGFNIEGLAWAPGGDLLLGLRSPTVGSKAIMLRLPHVDDLFDHPAGLADLREERPLALGGRGIRGMCHDAKRSGYWIVAGLSSDLQPVEGTPKNDWSLWFWDGTGEPVRKASRNDLPEFATLEAPETVCVVESKDGQKAALLLVGDDGAGHPSPYRLVPMSSLKL